MFTEKSLRSLSSAHEKKRQKQKCCVYHFAQCIMTLYKNTLQRLTFCDISRKCHLKLFTAEYNCVLLSSSIKYEFDVDYVVFK